MKQGPEGRRTVKPLDWRALLKRGHAASLDDPQDAEASLDHERLLGLGAVLDSIAAEAAKRGIDFIERAAPKLEEIRRQHEAGRLTDGQAEFMRDSHDALLSLVTWAHEEGVIDNDMKVDLTEAIN